MVAAAEEGQIHRQIMKILITGSGGMLGTDLTSELSPKFKIAGAGILPCAQPAYTQADLSVRENVSKLFEKEKPDVVIHTAAMTDVDVCETRREDASKANVEMTRLLADEANRHKAALIFFSTDYVFSGNKAGEYLENDTTDPGNFYGETKVLAENYIKQKSSKYAIFRITWLYGLNGKSFPRTIMERAKTQKKFEIVSDQTGRPTYTRDVAVAISTVLSDKTFFQQKGNAVYHLCNSGQASWAEFGEFILKHSGHEDAEVVRIDSTRLARPAKRPLNSVLSLEKTGKELGIRLRPWRDAALQFIREFQS